MADAYKLLADASFPKALSKYGQDSDGGDLYVVEGRNYAAGDFVLASDLTPRDQERATSGELDHLLEAATVEDYEASLGHEFGVFIPEHEAEAFILAEAGHQVVPRDQAITLLSAGAEAAGTAQTDAKADGADERPGVGAVEFPSLADVSRGEAQNVPVSGSEHVPDDVLASAPSSSEAGVEMPPGIAVGDAKAAAEGDDSVDAPAPPASTLSAAPKRKVGRPRKDPVEPTPAPEV